MFTGLIQEKSKVLSFVKLSNEFDLEVSKPPHWHDLKLGESIAIDGVCLTLTKQNNQSLNFFVGIETINKTHFSKIHIGKTLNLERSLALGDRLGGHMVTGHVDGTAEILQTDSSENGLHVAFQVTREQFKNIIPKGSICVNGVSLTVNSISKEDRRVEVYLIPETLQRTNLSELQAADIVNIECDPYVKVIAHQFSLLGDLREYNP
jgi:riboflavin synthase